MCLGHYKSQHEIPICYHLKALGCLGFNTYLLEWNHRDSSETMKMPLFVNTFLLEPAVFIEPCSLDGFCKQNRFCSPIQTLGLQDLYVKLWVHCHALSLKICFKTIYLLPYLLCGHACVSMYVRTRCRLCVKAGVAPWSPSTLCLGTRSFIDLEPAG